MNQIITTKTQQQLTQPNSTKPNSITQSGGRYIHGGNTSILHGKVGFWDPVIFSKDVSDISFLLGQKYHMRPDKLAFDIFGKATLMWFVLQYNNIIDVTEFVSGLQITLPTKSRLLTQILTKSK